MSLIALATTALTLATPYLVKTGEKIAEKIGEEIWNFIKTPFGTNENTTDMTLSENQESFKQELIDKLNTDSKFENELRSLIENAEKQLVSNTQQIINNNGNIEKQVNIGNVSGNIQL